MGGLFVRGSNNHSERVIATVICVTSSSRHPVLQHANCTLIIVVKKNKQKIQNLPNEKLNIITLHGHFEMAKPRSVYCAHRLGHDSESGITLPVRLVQKHHHPHILLHAWRFWHSTFVTARPTCPGSAFPAALQHWRWPIPGPSWQHRSLSVRIDKRN